MRSIGIRNRRRRFVLFLAAALGAVALLALPSLAAAKARDRNHEAAKARDRNHDGIPDRWEKRHRLSLRVNQARRNQDHDGLDNRQEFLAGTNPRDRDSDNDGVMDGEGAGRIVSFDAETGQLTIALFQQGTLTGTVTEQTEIECPQSGSATVSDEGTGDGGQQGTSDGGGTQQESSDDSSGEGNEASDDDNAEGQENENEEENDGEGQDEEDRGSCTTADLQSAAEQEGVVSEAELRLENGEAVFEKVELAR